MKKILILFAHPKFEYSDTNKCMLNAVSDLENVEIRDLYELYPEFDISIKDEQECLLRNDIIIWQHPFYWFSCPPLLKQWIDLVLEFGWAYGPGGTYLKDKYLMNAISMGGSEEAYQADGSNRYTIHEFLRPFEQTARFCDMRYLPPFHINGTHHLSSEEISEKAQEYKNLLLHLSNTPEVVYQESLS